MKIGRAKFFTAALAAFVAALLWFIAWERIQDSRRLTQPVRVHTDGGTNYVVQLLESTIGKTDPGYVLLLYLRLENENAFPVALRRGSFVLLDDNKRRYEPTSTAAQSPLIELPPNGVLEKEMLSFSVPDHALAGGLKLEVGRDYLLMVKDRKTFAGIFKRDEFRTFRRRRW